MGTRRRGREAALQILYQIDGGEITADRALGLYFDYLATSEEGREFAEAIVRRYVDERARIDVIIRGVSHHWRLERMTRVDRNILRLGVAELLLGDDVPRRVTLNEAVELAKRFGAEGSTGFVNGILDRIATDLSGETGPGSTPPPSGSTPPAPGSTPPAPGSTPPAPGGARSTPPGPRSTPPGPRSTPQGPRSTPPGSSETGGTDRGANPRGGSGTNGNGGRAGS